MFINREDSIWEADAAERIESRSRSRTLAQWDSREESSEIISCLSFPDSSRPELLSSEALISSPIPRVIIIVMG
jgi:hypothetical protein